MGEHRVTVFNRIEENGQEKFCRCVVDGVFTYNKMIISNEGNGEKFMSANAVIFLIDSLKKLLLLANLKI